MGKILPNKKTDVTTIASISGAKSKQGRKRTVALLIVGSLLVYAVFFATAALFTYNLLDNKGGNNNLTESTPWVPTTYDMMSAESQISVKLYNDTGKGLGEIENATPTKELLPSFEKAYSAAQAMYYTKKYTKSLEIYAFADTYNAKTKNYVFYLDYAAVAQTAQNKEVFEKQIEAAKNSINADKSIGEAKKVTLITGIDEKLALIKLEQP